jgi:polysaccharide pyruvyl transferase WcaK-like protein
VRSRHIVLFGHFGVGNLGNDASLEAALVNIRRLVPDATVTCVCRGPSGVSSRFGIPAIPIDVNEDRSPGVAGGRRPGLAARLVSRVFDEGDFWVRRTSWFRSVDQFVVVGTGAIYDATSPPWNVPYDLFKWCRAARLGGAEVVFLSVGAGPIVHRASRALMVHALRSAQYRSYRDTASFAYLQSVGFDTSRDHLYPDVVFSLPLADAPAPRASVGQPARVGLGVMAYYGPAHDTSAGAPLYRAYVTQMTRFLHWLLAQGHHVRLLTGDLENDPQPADELMASVRASGRADWQAQVVAEPIRSVQDLSAQVARTDVVVASRFHNLVAALMLGRPAMSIGFHEKNDALMADMGLEAYCQHIERIDVDRLVSQFEAIVAEFAAVAERVARRSAEYSARLEEQYARVFGHVTGAIGHRPGSADVPAHATARRVQ